MFRETSKKVALVVNFGAAYTGLATVGYKLWNGDGTQFQARTTTGVSEIRAGTGAYKVEVANSVFTADFDGYVEWDTGGGSPIYAYEDIHISAILDHALSDIDTEIDALTTSLAAVKTKTDNLPTDPADASDIAASFSSIASTLSTIAGYIDTEVAAIKAKTDNLPSDPADASDVAAAITAAQSALAAAITALGTPAQDDALTTLQATVDQIKGYVDTEVGTIRNAE